MAAPLDNDRIAVKVDDLYKTFLLPHEKQSSLKSSLINFGKRGFEKQHVLDGISFEIQKGEFFGIVGRNGSGKSTLLKLMAGIYTPDKGEITVNGKLTPFIELGVGFNPELTGRENVFLNGALLGFSRKTMESMYGDIVEFAELERFMDQKLKNYSSGMQVRLAFSIAIRANTDILLLDEVLAVGDEAFQRKCYEYFDDLKRNKKTVIIVTHDMSAVEKFCNKAVLIEDGRIIKQGRSATVARAYSELFAQPVIEEEPEEAPEVKQRWGAGGLSFADVRMSADKTLQQAGRLGIDISLECKTPANGPVAVAYTVKDADGRALFGYIFETKDLSSAKAGSTVQLTLSFADILAKGDYALDLSLRRVGEEQYMDFWTDALTFSVTGHEANALGILASSTLQISGK